MASISLNTSSTIVESTHSNSSSSSSSSTSIEFELLQKAFNEKIYTWQQFDVFQKRVEEIAKTASSSTMEHFCKVIDESIELSAWQRFEDFRGHFERIASTFTPSISLFPVDKRKWFVLEKEAGVADIVDVNAQIQKLFLKIQEVIPTKSAIIEKQLQKINAILGVLNFGKFPETIHKEIFSDIARYFAQAKTEEEILTATQARPSKALSHLSYDNLLFNLNDLFSDFQTVYHILDIKAAYQKLFSKAHDETF